MTHIRRATSDIIIDNIIIGYHENVFKSQKYSWRNIEIMQELLLAFNGKHMPITWFHELIRRKINNSL